jgi:hypothetical protein
MGGGPVENVPQYSAYFGDIYICQCHSRWMVRCSLENFLQNNTLLKICSEGVNSQIKFE